MRTMCSREILTKKCRQQQIFDSDLKGAWHYNHVAFTPIAKNFMLYCRFIYMLSILCVRLTIKVKVGIPESFKVGWYVFERRTSTGSGAFSLLRANVCNFRESVDSREFLYFLIFCPNNLYSTLISKITFKLVTAFYFILNRAKFEKR